MGKGEKENTATVGRRVLIWRLKFVVLNYIFCQFYELFTDPHGLDYLKVGAKCYKHAQKLLYVVELAYVLVAGLSGDDKVLK